MTPRVSTEEQEYGQCGCGRSPTGKCCGWHGLTEEMYQHQRMLWLEEQFRQDDEVSQNNGEVK